MKLVVGLGNPGNNYNLTRHNLGFSALDALATQLDLLEPVNNAKFHASVVETMVGDCRVILAKPQIYMNNSGQSVQALVQFYKIAPQDIWVLHDELDVPFSELRIKQGGGDAGHNGLKSITAAIGPDYWRFRLGIANSTLRNPIDPVDFVLQKFYTEEQTGLEQLTTATAERLLGYLENGTTPESGTYKIV